MSNKIEDLNIDFSFKKNNVDELFFNLSENPEHFKNKDFRYTLSMIYQIIEDEFAGVFLSPDKKYKFLSYKQTDNFPKG